jgi:hypothetical protein
MRVSSLDCDTQCSIGCMTSPSPTTSRTGLLVAVKLNDADTLRPVVE